MHVIHRSDGPFGGALPGIVQRDCSEATAHALDEEVKQLLAGAYVEAKSILERHRDQLERVAGALLESETLGADEFRRLLSEPVNTGGESP